MEPRLGKDSTDPPHDPSAATAAAAAASTCYVTSGALSLGVGGPVRTLLPLGFFGFVRGGGYLAEGVQEGICHRAPGNN